MKIYISLSSNIPFLAINLYWSLGSEGTWFCNISKIISSALSIIMFSLAELCISKLSFESSPYSIVILSSSLLTQSNTGPTVDLSF